MIFLFEIEREVILSSTDKNSKIPILNEYRKRPKGAIAPDAPHIQLAWTEDKRGMEQIHSNPPDSVGGHQLYKAQPMTLLDSSRTSEPSPISRSQDNLNGYSSGQGTSTGAVPRTPAAHSTPEGEGGQPKPFPTRTYHTIKGMISSRFNKRSDKVEELSPQSQLRQHGVYLASSHTPGPSSAEIMRRNQEIQRQIKERKEAQDDGGFQEVPNRNHGGSIRHQTIEMETPRRAMPEPAYQLSRAEHERIVTADMTPSLSHQRIPQQNTTSVMRPGDVYGRMPSSYYQDGGGYGVPGTRKSVTDAENARKIDIARREERYHFQQNQQRHQQAEERLGKEMENMGVYVSRNPGEGRVSSKTPESRTPDFNRRTDFSENRTISQSVERLNSDIREVNGVEVYKSDNARDKEECKEEQEDDDEGGFKGGAGSDYEKLRSGGQSDSGRGSTVYSSGKAKTERNVDTSPEPNTVTGHGDSQWVDIVESELRHILDPKLHINIANSTLSESISSMTPPLPPLSPGGSSDDCSPTYKHKSLPYNSKPEYSAKSQRGPAPGRAMWSARVSSKDKSSHHRLPPKPSTKMPSVALVSGKTGSGMGSAPPFCSLENNREAGTTLLLCFSIEGFMFQQLLHSTGITGSLDLDSMLDEENNSSDEELSTTIDTADTRTIRKQLEGLESMYSEVLKLLGVKKQHGRYQPSDPRVNKRRLYGSLSSLPSSVSSRPIRDKRRHDQSERKKVKDLKGINKRFQRLESHVVTLARSVAHLSSEMRTQHLMIQEMEVIRGELAALRTQSNMAATRSQSMPRTLNRLSVEQSNSNPERVKKLTKFFGDEPPLLRLFLKKLGLIQLLNETPVKNVTECNPTSPGMTAAQTLSRQPSRIGPYIKKEVSFLLWRSCE
ncbi:hypothetical protein J6590_040908 [Homalodisca vitripennis]|nr:hypothetical protein J6590_040908 [Homalodisca vitripennis]